jgi:hypothetical protein
MAESIEPPGSEPRVAVPVTPTIERMAVAMYRLMRQDIGRAHDWANEPERHRNAFRRAAAAAFMAEHQPDTEPMP